MMASHRSIAALAVLAAVSTSLAFSPPTPAIRQSTELPLSKQPIIATGPGPSSTLRLHPSTIATPHLTVTLAAAPTFRRSSPLFRSSLNAKDDVSHEESGISNSNNNSPGFRPLRRVTIWFKSFLALFMQWKPLKSMQRTVAIVMASAMIWLGTAGSYIPPAAASTPTNVIERILPSSDNNQKDQIVDRYVKQHMFDTDDATSQDPFESAYREANADYKTDGSYPRALKEIASEVMGSSSVAVGKRASEDGSGGIFGVLLSTVRLMERRIGISEKTALTIIGGGLVLATPITGLLAASMISIRSKRSMNKLMKDRYGDGYTVDATMKEVSDDDDENDEEEEDNEDDDE